MQPRDPTINSPSALGHLGEGGLGCPGRRVWGIGEGHLLAAGWPHLLQQQDDWQGFGWMVNRVVSRFSTGEFSDVARGTVVPLVVVSTRFLSNRCSRTPAAEHRRTQKIHLNYIWSPGQYICNVMYA